MFRTQATVLVPRIMATCLAVATAGLYASRVLAVAIPVSQERLVQADAGASDFNGLDDPAAEFQLAPDFNPFDAVVSQSAQQGAASGSATSRQSSRIDPLELTAAGDLSVGGSTSEPFSSGASGLAGSRFDVFFELVESHPFRLTAQMSGSLVGEVLGRIDGRVLFVRVDPGPEFIADRTLPGGDAAFTIDLEGILQPGRHRLIVESTLGGTLAPDATGGASFTGQANHDVRLILPEPATLSSMLVAAILASVCRLRRIVYAPRKRR